MTLDSNNAETNYSPEVIDLAARFWDLANSDLSNGYAMIEMAEILQEIAEVADALPTMIVRRLRPEPVDSDDYAYVEALKVAYLAENFWTFQYFKFDEHGEHGKQRDDKLDVRDAGEAGKGLFAKEEIKKGEVIFVSTGKRKISCSPYESREVVKADHDDERKYTLKPRNPDELWPNAICVGEEDLEQIVGSQTSPRNIKANIWLDPSPTCPLRYLNHSCEPNIARTADAVTFVAMRDIAPNEQLTCDYSTLEVNPDWHMDCKCGAAHCRGVVGAIQSLPDELLETYGRYLPPFMMDLFKRSHPNISQDVYHTIGMIRWMLVRH